MDDLHCTLCSQNIKCSLTHSATFTYGHEGMCDVAIHWTMGVVTTTRIVIEQVNLWQAISSNVVGIHVFVLLSLEELAMDQSET